MTPLQPTPPALTVQYTTLSEIAARPDRPDADRWLWQGYLAAGNVTLLVGPWKAGKTTLLSVLLARLGTGGALAGLAVRPGRAVVITEEDEELWKERARRLGIGGQVTLVSRPFRGRRPTPDQWHQLIDSLAARHEAVGFDLVVVDPLADFLPSRTENNAAVVLDMLMPLQELTRRGVGSLILHHPHKGPTVAGQAARGSGALGGSVDVLIEMDPVGGLADDDRRRRLSAYSRHRATPRRLVIELNAEGTDYAALGDYLGHEFEENWRVLAGVLEDTNKKLTRADILAQWPADYARPSPPALWRWLDRAVRDGLVLVEGTGRRKDPFKYWLKGIEAKWATDPELLFWASLPPVEPLPSMAEVMGLTRREPPQPPRRARKGGGAGPVAGKSAPAEPEAPSEGDAGRK